MSRLGRVVVLLTVLPLSAPVLAAEMRVHGEVVDVVPVGGGAVAGPSDDCQPPRPGAEAGLAALLAWDLRVHCPPAPAAAAYRVYYRWDGRTYSRIMHQHPGATVPLRVRLD